MKRILIYTLLSLLLFPGILLAGDGFNEKFSLYGYMIDYASFNFDIANGNLTNKSLGNSVLLRLKGDWKPEDNLRFHMEASYYEQLGNMNPYILYSKLGMTPDFEEADLALHNFYTTFFIDHLWGRAVFDNFDIQFGKFPISWGTGYVFNPTSRVAVPPFLDMVTEESRGVMALMPSWAISDTVSLSGYLAFQDKTLKTTVLSTDTQWMNLPFGIRGTAILGSYDFSLSWFKEVIYNSYTVAYQRSHYLGFDFVGALAAFGVYGESSLRFPMTADGSALDTANWEFMDNLDFVLGFDYEFVDPEITARLEYFYQGTGAKNTSEYSIVTSFTGERLVQARNYAFLSAEKSFKDKLKLMVGAIGNFDDKSIALLPMISYDAYDNFQVTFGAFMFSGKTGDEFTGEYTMVVNNTPVTVDLIEDYMIYLRMKLSF